MAVVLLFTFLDDFTFHYLPPSELDVLRSKALGIMVAVIRFILSYHVFPLFEWKLSSAEYLPGSRCEIVARYSQFA